MGSGDSLTGSMGDIHCRLLTQHLDRIDLIDRQIDELNKLSAAQMQKHQDAVLRLIEVPGIGAEAAQEILAEIGPQAAAFPSSPQLASWIGVCPGSNQSAGENHSGRSAKGIASCAACCVKPRRRQSGPKGATCSLFFNASSFASHTSRQSGPSLTAYAKSSGTSYTRELDSSNSARP